MAYVLNSGGIVLIGKASLETGVGIIEAEAAFEELATEGKIRRATDVEKRIWDIRYGYAKLN